MVLERLVSIRDALKNPWGIFVTGGVVSVTCLFISFVIFPQAVGVYTTFLITIAMTPFMVNLTRREEEREEHIVARNMKQNLIQRHREILVVYAAFFSGMILSFSIIFLMLPAPVVEHLFQEQVETIKLIRGNATFFGSFETILLNNIGVLFVSFLFSFLFGAGAIFVLTWNATILSTAIGLSAKTAGGYIALPFAILFYFPHGSLEILAYFIGAIAGGIVSAALMRSNKKWSTTVLKDSFIFLGIAVAILVLAAFIESFAIVQFA